MIVTIVLCFLLAHRAGYDIKCLEKMGVIDQQYKFNWATNGWERSLEKMDYDADIVFFGDSITAGSDFRQYFPGTAIVELGIPGDTIIGMTNRVGMIKSLEPKKVFVLGGINSLTDSNAERVILQYRDLLVTIKEALPTAEIYVQSVLPISVEQEAKVCHNSSIEMFNEKIESLCLELQVVYVDLFSVFEKNGSMNPDFTKDGIHLQPDAYSIWASKIEKYVN